MYLLELVQFKLIAQDKLPRPPKTYHQEPRGDKLSWPATTYEHCHEQAVLSPVFLGFAYMAARDHQM